MKLALRLLTAAGLASTAAGNRIVAGNDFFIPMPESPLFTDTFKKIHKYYRPGAPVHTLISVTVSTDGTLVYWDHHEDGFEADSTQPTQASTEIWGDGDPSNGCRPKADAADRVCTDASHDPPFLAGDAVIIKEVIPIPRDESVQFYDGGDHVRGTYPMTVVRGAFPDNPGSLMAGAVEVMEKRYWGKNYEMPVRINDALGLNAFQYCKVWVMAGEDNTVVNLPDGTTVTMNKGDNRYTTISNEGVEVNSDKPVQVHILTGDTRSNYELRWYALLPRNVWSSKYLSPVGTTEGRAKVIVYNPKSNPTSTFKVKRYSGSSWVTESLSITSGENKQTTNHIPNDSGAWIYQENDRPFIALSIVDTSSNTGYSGQIYDWGSPIPATWQLTSQVLVGLGFGCTHNDCDWRGVRSVVWIAPVEDATIYVDRNNDGVIDLGDRDQVHDVDQWRSLKVHDEVTEDLSGALIYATKRNSNEPVRISVVWGQDPDLAVVNDADAMDLGTLVAPFSPTQVSETVELVEDINIDGDVNPHDVIMWTIQVQNVGQVDIDAGILTIVGNPIDDQTIYKDATTTWEVMNPGQPTETGTVSDVGTTNLPLDESGFVIPRRLDKRGGMIYIRFKATVKGRDFINDPPLLLTDSGHLYQAGYEEPQVYSAQIDVVIPPPPTCSGPATISGPALLARGGSASPYTCAATMEYNMVPAANTFKLMGVNPNGGDDELLGEASVADQLLPGAQSNLGIAQDMMLSCNNEGTIVGATGPSSFGVNFVPMEVYTIGPCGQSTPTPVRCEPPTCSGPATISGPGTLPRGGPASPYTCAASMEYFDVPSNKKFVLMGVNPDGEDEVLGEASVADQLPTGFQTGLGISTDMGLSCNNAGTIVGPSGPSAIGVNFSPMEVYTIGPCGQSAPTPVQCEPPSCSGPATISGPEILEPGAAAIPYTCGATMEYLDAPPSTNFVLMGVNPDGEDEVLGEASVADQLPTGFQTGLGVSTDMGLSCSPTGTIIGPSGPSTIGTNFRPMEVYTVGPCGQSAPTPVRCNGSPPPEGGDNRCMSILNLSGPSSIHTGASRSYPCDVTMTYTEDPSTTTFELFAQNPDGEDELLGQVDGASDIGAAPQTGLAFTKHFQLSCQGNDLHGMFGASALGANGQEINIYSVGPCGQSSPIPVVCRNDAGGGANGDPHVKTWRNRHFDYNGECDLVLITSKGFDNGAGLDVHIRTKIRRDMSYIANAALRIGNDILEVASKGLYSINGEANVPLPATLSGYPVTYSETGPEKKRQQVFEINLGGHERIWIKVFKDFVSVLVDKATPMHFGDAQGLMGDFTTGHLVSRNGLTIMEDLDAFGQEWQVTDQEPKLFVDKDRFPQYPAKCHMPQEAAADHRRRLAESDKELLVAAEEACGKLYEGDAKEDCVFDVLSTGDLEMADSGAY